MKYNIGFICSCGIAEVQGIHKHLTNTRSYCASQNVTPVAHIMMSDFSYELATLLKVLGFSVIMYTEVQKGTVLKIKDKMSLRVVDNAFDTVVSVSESIVFIGESTLKDKVPSSKASYVYERIVKPKVKRSTISPNDIIEKAKRIKDNTDDPYQQFNYVKDYKKPERKEEPSFFDRIPPEIRDLIPPDRQDPFVSK